MSGTACTAQHTIPYHTRELTTNSFLPFQEMYEGLVASSDCDNMPWVCVYQKRGKIHVQVCDTIQPKCLLDKKNFSEPSYMYP